MGSAPSELHDEALSRPGTAHDTQTDCQMRLKAMFAESQHELTEESKALEEAEEKTFHGGCGIHFGWFNQSCRECSFVITFSSDFDLVAFIDMAAG